MVVFPEPLYPTISVSGVLNWMASRTAGLKERTPEMESLSIFDMLGGYRIEGRVKAKFAMLGPRVSTRSKGVDSLKACCASKCGLGS